jgi:hypothetical protein
MRPRTFMQRIADLFKPTPRLSIGGIQIVAECADPRAWTVIQSVAMSVGRKVPDNSGWHVELPQAVLRLLDTKGDKAARAMVERCFAENSSLAAAHYLGVA